MTVELWIFIGTWFLAIGALLGTAHLRNWRISRQKMRVPVAEKLLRGPGESLRKKLEELDEQLSLEMAVAFVLPLIYVGSILVQQSKLHSGWGGITFFTIVGVVGYAVVCRRIHRVLGVRRNYRLGLGGERAVGEELNQLMLTGCRVFHDVPNAPYGNIDHVLVAASGVYAVETKARRKKDIQGGEAHKVIFDGRSLRFGGGPPENKCLEQAAQQASRLSDWLSKAVGEPVEVQPVLALPGWFVERRGKGEVIVVSGRAVKTLVKGRNVLELAMIERIAHQLDQRCRDVEF